MADLPHGFFRMEEFALLLKILACEEELQSNFYRHCLYPHFNLKNCCMMCLNNWLHITEQDRFYTIGTSQCSQVTRY